MIEVYITGSISFPQALSEIWDVLTEDERQTLHRESKVFRYDKHEVIYSIDEEPQYMMWLLEGRIKIYIEGVSNRRQIMRVIRPYQSLGYRAHFAQEPYLTNASALCPSTLLLTPLKLIDQFLATNNALAQYFIKQLSIDLGVADERTVSLTQKHIRGRIAESLIFLLDSYGYEKDKQTLSFGLNRNDLASLSNMTTSNAIRTLAAFAAEGLVILDGKKIKITNEKQLRTISQQG